MVNDLVAKVLDEDCTSSNDIFSNRCNGNSHQYQAKNSTAQNYKTNLGNNAYPSNGLYNSCEPLQESNGTVGFLNQDYKNICNDLSSINLSMCMGQQNHDKGNVYSTNGFTENLQRYILKIYFIVIIKILSIIIFFFF